MSSQPTAASGHSSEGTAPSGEHGGNRLGWFLCWAVVFADIGTSVYYVPGILYEQPGVGRLAGLFVAMTLVAFLLLTLKYAEVSVRFPEGGGVVTVAARGLNPWAGAIGGMFILVDYFLTAAISSLSGVQYFSGLFPAIGPFILPITLFILVALGVLNWWGIKESAIVSAVIAVAAILSDAVILVVVLIHVPLPQLARVFREVFAGHTLTGGVLITGFAGAFLAFSGLESISQLSPVMRTPRNKTVTWALAGVAITVGISGPLLTIFSTTLLNVTQANSDKLISQLGGAYGGDALRVATAVTASALLIFASNTAIIGAYHVFLALSRMQFFPTIIERTNRVRGTPHVSILLATGIPIGVLIVVNGNINTLGDMYAFGLLGAFTLTCIALDVMRVREHKRGVTFSATAEDEAHALVAWSHGIKTEGEPPEGCERYQHILRSRELTVEEFDALTQDIVRRRQETAKPFGALGRWVSRGWPQFLLVSGFFTTFLVCLAWATNLYAKPPATIFGGLLTLLGLSVAIVNYRRQTRKGLKPIHPERRLRPIPGSVLVVLPSGRADNAEVVRAAVHASEGRPLVFLGLGKVFEPHSRSIFQITDSYYHDEEMKATFGLAEALCTRGHIDHQFFYLVRTPASVATAWRVVESDEVMGDTSIAQELPGAFAKADYIRKQPHSDVRIAVRSRHGPGREGEVRPRRSREVAGENITDATPQPTPHTSATHEVPPTIALTGEPPAEAAERSSHTHIGAAREASASGESSPRFKKVLNTNRGGYPAAPIPPRTPRRKTPPPELGLTEATPAPTGQEEMPPMVAHQPDTGATPEPGTETPHNASTRESAGGMPRAARTEGTREDDASGDTADGPPKRNPEVHPMDASSAQGEHDASSNGHSVRKSPGGSGTEHVHTLGGRRKAAGRDQSEEREQTPKPRQAGGPGSARLRAQRLRRAGQRDMHKSPHES